MKLIFLFFLYSNLAQGFIRPSSTPALTNDPYFSYLWGLATENQLVVGDINDIIQEEFHPIPQADINWSPDFDQLMKKEVVVAVIDSGVDIEHEDLKESIYLNPAECTEDGKIPLGRTGDPDGNGFEGDCAGWNFATRSKKLERLPYDEKEIAHGTHVAGIIGAKSNNLIGISGLSNKIKILPIKVYDKSEGSPSPFPREVISTRVAKAINYAIKRNVDVINMSLGWPFIGNSPSIRKTINEAYEKGIFIVAAAGNDSHEGLIYPCSLKHVFCVGSTDINGKLSRFSNFGGQVDLLAPGGQVLSTIPMTASSNLFGIQGYDIKFGTSQASPYVAGAAAIIKGIFPEVSIKRIAEALRESSTFLFPYFSSGGVLNIKRAINYLQENQYRLTPSFKEIDLVEVDSELKGQLFIPLSFSESMPIIEHTKALNSVEVISESAAVQLDFFTKEEGIYISLSSHDFWMDAKFKFIVKIKERAYSHQVQLVQSSYPLEKFFANEVNLDELTTIPSPKRIDSGVRYYIFKDKKLSIYKLEKNQLTLVFQKDFPHIDQLPGGIGINRVDINLDGKLDYLITGLTHNEDGTPVGLRLAYLEESGRHINQRLVQKNSNSMAYFSDFSLPNPQKNQFLKVQHPQLGELFLPVFISKGPAETIDQIIDPFNPASIINSTHLNFLWPTDNGLMARTYTDQVFRENINIQLNIPSYSLFSPLTLRLEDERPDNIIKAFVQVEKDYYHLFIGAEDLIQSAKIIEFPKPSELYLKPFQTTLDFSNQAFDESIDLYNDEIKQGTIVRGLFSKDRMRIVSLGDDKVENSRYYSTSDPREVIASLIKRFKTTEGFYDFFELDTLLEVVAEERTFSASLYRTSFIQGSNFTLLHAPVLARDRNQKIIPAIYVDNSNLFSASFYLRTLTSKLSIPLRYSFKVPSGCSTMDPFIKNNQTFSVIKCSQKEHHSKPYLATIKI